MMDISLKCPLCCEESFPSHSSLKYHILSLTENLVCPACDKRFYNIYELTDHLGRGCEDCKDDIVDNVLECVAVEFESVSKTSEMNPIKGLQNELIVPKSEKLEIEEDTYFCHVCNINIISVEEHLQQYHQGEDIIMEPIQDKSSERGHAEISADWFYSESDVTKYDNDEETENDILSDTTNQVIEEQQCIDKDGRIYTRRLVKTNEFSIDNNENVAPITEKYTIDSAGKIRKIDIDEYNSVDKEATFIIHQCPNCYLQFPLLDHYKKHICNPSKTKNKFKCIHCTKIFNTFETLHAHIKTHLVEKSPGELKRVITMEPYKCEVCSTIFPSHRSLRLHQRMHEPVKDKIAEPPVKYSISGCSEQSTEKEHVRRMFVCNICNNTYDKEYEDIHMKSHSETENFDCKVCNRKFYTKENLEMHSRAHKQSNKFTCSYCKKSFIAYESLEEHVANQCQNRQYECQYCGRRFSRPHEKVKHERIHTGEKPHVCQICGKSFRVSYCLTLHLRTHSGTRPYKCDHCGKRFKSHSVYNHHMLTHSNVRGYKCPFCPKAFKTSVQLAGHKNSHTKPFTCNECNRPFASLYAVRTHMETHKRENNLKHDCWECGATYARAHALKDHMKTHEVTTHVVLDNTEMTAIETVESTTEIENQMEMEDIQQEMNS